MPLCKHPVVETGMLTGVASGKPDASSNYPRNFGATDTCCSNQKLLKVGRTDKIDGFTGKNGAFATALGYDPEKNRYSFVK